ncbi:MAG: radical SAM protein [Chloroflexi bacterium]|nr:radical SAM protein [Chloroflexota bacterium]
MKVALTNCGARYAIGLLKQNGLSQIDHDAECCLLLDLWTGILVPYEDKPVYNRLLDQGLIERVSENVSRSDIARRYWRNPLEHVERVIFEYTTRCDFNCHHCYNARVNQATEQDVDVLKSAVDVFVRIGIRRFAFVGGEVSKYGDGWLKLVRHIHVYDDVTVAMYTNGWWLGQSDFMAAGQHYSDVAMYLAMLKESGLTHVVFSLDGAGEAHDHSRQRPGLYNQIMEGFNLVREAGLEPRVSLLVHRGGEEREFVLFLAELAEQIYDFPSETGLLEKALMLTSDPTNTLSNFIDIGSGARRGATRFGLSDVPDSLLYCKGFFRMAPSLTIKANGEIATCRVTNAGEGYGNLHDHDLVHILNRLQNSFVFRLHAERWIREYRRFVNPDIFGDSFAHVCTLRAILTLIARRMEEAAVDPGDEEAIFRINREVARYTGHLGK